MSATPAAQVAAPRAGAALAGRLAVAALALALPVAMTIANKSAPAVLAAGAGLALAGAWLGGRGADLAQVARGAFFRPVAPALAAWLVLAALSLIWSVDRAIGVRGFVEGLPVLACALAACAALPLVAKRRDGLFLAAGLAAAVALVGVEMWADMPLHGLAGARADASAEKRAAILVATLLWPALALLLARGKWTRGEWIGALGLFAACMSGAGFASSGASLFGLAAGAGAFGVAWAAPRLALNAAVAIVALALVLAPFMGLIGARFVDATPDRAGALFHVSHRIVIWREFGARVGDRLWLGHGYNASSEISDEPSAAPRGADARQLIEKIHPHNAFLQIWVEFGILGVVAALLSLRHLRGSLLALSPRRLPARLAFFFFVAAVMLVSHSMWQPWWIAAIGAGLAWFRVVDPEPGDPAPATPRKARMP